MTTKLKPITFGFILLLIPMYTLAQQDAPAVEWKKSDYPPQFPVSPIVFPTTTDPIYQPGQPNGDYSHEFRGHRTGEDWWYSIAPATMQNGGYYAAGFATWVNFEMNEAPAGGCKSFAPTPADLERPVLQDEVLSFKLSTVAYYDKKGKMIWHNAYIPAFEGAYSCKEDLDGNIVITGWTNSTRDVHGNPVLFNPTPGFAGHDLDVSLCVYNGNKAFIAKIAPNGDLIWAHTYSMYDFGDFGHSDQDLIAKPTFGLDLIVDSNGDYVVVGTQNGGFSINNSLFLVKVNSDGEILKRTEVNLDDYRLNPRSISRYGNDILVGGYAEEIIAFPRSHAFVTKFDADLNPVLATNFGHELKFGTFYNGSAFDDRNFGFIWVENLPGGHPNNIVFDTKELANGNVAVVTLEDCERCKHSSGANLSIGNLRIYDSNGTALVPSVNGGQPIRINENGDGYVKAFDLKIGLEADDPNEITLITTVADGEIVASDPDFDVFEESMDVISNGTSSNSEDFLLATETYTPRDGSAPITYNNARSSALLANYTIDGQLRWEKVIDGDDAPLQPYPGDWKEQECVYQVMKGEDGEYVFVGNSSHNKDDYLTIKVYGNCQLDKTYEIAPTDPVADNTVNVGPGVVHWNPATFDDSTEIYARGEIHVLPNTILQISGGLVIHFADGEQMVYDTKLIVEPGARLLVNNATLTSTDCPRAMWKGIEVWGNEDLSQNNTSNQGFLEISNNAKIENAYNGVQVWKRNDWEATGGIVRATNAHFLNNRRDIQFLPYSNIVNGSEQNNRSFFTNTTFTTDNNYKLEGIFPHITMYKVSGVSITGCDFTDQRFVAATDPMSLNRGIFSIDAKYKVLGRFIGTTASIDEYYNPANYDGCTFTNLLTGVHAMNANTQNTITVDQSLFTNCRFGVNLSQVNNAMITRNKMVKTLDFGLYLSQHAIYTDKCTAYQIEGNTVENNLTTGANSYGITIHNSGLEDNEAYKNRLDGVHRGANSFGKNRNDGTIALANYEGLEFLCNQHTNNQVYDESIAGFGLLDGEKIVQGTVEVPARNEFSTVGSGVTYHLANFVNDDLYYIYNTNVPIQEPILISSGVFPIGANITPVSCPTNFTIVRPGPGKPIPNPVVKAQLIIDFEDTRSEWLQKKAEFDSLVAHGDRQTLHDAVANLTPANKVQVKNALLSEAPFLSVSLLTELADKSPGQFPTTWLKEVIVANIEVTRNKEFVDYLLTKEHPVPQGIYNQIVNAMGTYTDRTVKQHEVIQLNTEQNRIANFILKDITQDSLGIDSDEYNTWVAKRGDILCEFQFADFFLSQKLKDSCLHHLHNIDDQVSDMTAGILKQELEDYSAFKKDMLNLSNADGVLEGLDATTEATVRAYAEHAIGHAQVQAQNLLCFFLNECAEVPEFPEDSPGNSAMIILPATNSYESTTDSKSNNFTIYPNPANNQVIIELNELEANQFQLFDLNGRLIKRGQINGQKTSLAISELENGVYLLNILIDNEVVGVQRLFKQ